MALFYSGCVTVERRNPWLVSILLILLIVGAAAGFA